MIHLVVTLTGASPVSCLDIAVPHDEVYRTDANVTVTLVPGNNTVTIPIRNIDSKWLLLYIDTDCYCIDIAVRFIVTIYRQLLDSTLIILLLIYYRPYYINYIFIRYHAGCSIRHDEHGSIRGSWSCHGNNGCGIGRAIQPSDYVCQHCDGYSR